MDFVSLLEGQYIRFVRIIAEIKFSNWWLKSMFSIRKKRQIETWVIKPDRCDEAPVHSTFVKLSSRICYALDRRFKIMNPSSEQLAAKVQILSDISLKSSLKLFVSSWISFSCTRTFSSLESVDASEASAAIRTCALFVSVRASFMLCLGQVIASFFPLCLLVNKAKWNRFNKVFLRKSNELRQSKSNFFVSRWPSNRKVERVANALNIFSKWLLIFFLV